VASIPKGRSLYDCGVVVSPDHRLLADVSWQDLVRGESLPPHHAAMYKILLPPVQHIAGSVAVVTSVRPNNYFHWMFDILPRFEILRRSNLVPDFYLINTGASFQKESLQALNIPMNRTLSPTMHTHIEADELIVPSLPGPVFGATPQASTCKFLRSAFLPKDRTPAPHRRLYITRVDAKERRVINEADIR
jgi:capsular polysaccharide biosynthesis protein